MENTNNKNGNIFVMQMLKNFINKFTQTPDIYPIRYYKKGKRIGKNRNTLLI